MQVKAETPPVSHSGSAAFGRAAVRAVGQGGASPADIAKQCNSLSRSSLLQQDNLKLKKRPEGRGAPRRSNSEI